MHGASIECGSLNITVIVVLYSLCEPRARIARMHMALAGMTRDVVLEADVSARGRLKAVCQPVSPWLCLGDPAALAWLGLELSASASARSHNFCMCLGSVSKVLPQS